MRPGCGIELTTRSDGKDLPVWDTALKLVSLLDAEAELDTWRIVEVFSKTGLPFEVELGWSSGGGSGSGAKITVARSARICVFARSLQVRAGNLADLVNRVGITVADAYAVTVNQWEHRDSSPDQGVQLDVPIPPFARFVRVELADPSGLPTTNLKVYDGLGTLTATVAGDKQPPIGIPVGGARRFTVTSGSVGEWRAVYTLHL